MVIILTFQEGPSKRGGQPSGRLSAVRANLKSRSGLANICAYRDTSGLFTEEAPENDCSSQKGPTSESRPPTTQAPSSLSSTMAAASTIEDEEASSTMKLKLTIRFLLQKN